MNGQLSEHPLVELLREIQAEKLSGALRLLRERVKGIVYVDAGEARFASTNLRAHRLVEVARRSRLVNETQLAELSAAAKRRVEQMTDEEFGAQLVAAEIINQEELAALQTEQATDALRAMLFWTEGEWHFARLANAREAMGGLPQLAIELTPLLVEAARRLPVEFVAARMSNDAEQLASRVSFTNGNFADEMQDLSPHEAYILSRLEQPMSIGELIASTGLPHTDARQNLYMLALAGVIKREGWRRKLADAPLTEIRASLISPSSKTPINPPSNARAQTSHGKQNRAAVPTPPTPKKDAPPDPQIELNELFRRAAADNHFDVLGVGRNASSSEIKSAYHALAKRFHPDRFRRETEEVRARVEKSFARIAQSYDALKDETSRAAYILKLRAQEKREATNPSATPQTQASHANLTPPPLAPNLSPEQQAAERFKHGMEALKHGNSALAALIFAEVVRLAPDNARYHAMYGNALACDKRTHRQAEAELQRAISLDGREISYRIMLAEFYKQVGLRRRAISELERALEIDAAHTAARRLLDEIKQAESV